MQSNFKALEQSKHMLEWFSQDPFHEITHSVEEMFIQQSASTQLLRFELSSEPEWLTGGKPGEDPNQIIVVRCGLAIQCDFTLQDENGVYDLMGIFTWVAANLDQAPMTRMWMDLDGNMETFGKNGVLAARIYELDAQE